MVQRGHFFAIVDEVDSILIDEARTPLIISGSARRSFGFLQHHRHLHSSSLDKVTDYEVDEKQRTVALDRGRHGKNRNVAARRRSAQGRVALRCRERFSRSPHQSGTARAFAVQSRDKDYIVREGEVVIIDEFTGRMMPGRRYSEGLHQALEAKEKHVQVQPENQTLASITFQNYFRMYDKLAGMTGTALDRSGRILRHLQARSRWKFRPMSASRVSMKTMRSIARRTRKYASCDSGRGPARPCAAAAGPGRHRLDREVRNAWRIFGQEARFQADRLRRSQGGLRQALCRRTRRQAGQTVRGAERALPRTGSLYRRRGRCARCDHDRDQHGRPRHRHQARRLARNAAAARDRRDYRRGREGRASIELRSRPTSSASARSC